MSLGEILIKALMDTLMGMGTVFCILILICLIISLFKFIPKEEPAAAGAPVKAAPAPVKDEASDDDEIIAAILAAIRMSLEGQAIEAGTGEAVPQYVVRSVKRRR